MFNFNFKKFGKKLSSISKKMWLVLLIVAVIFTVYNYRKEIGGMPLDFFSQDKTTEKESGETSNEKDQGPVYNTPQEMPFYKDIIAGEDLSDPLVKRLVEKASALSFYEWQESKKREKVLLKVIEMIVDSIKQAGLEAELKHKSKSRV